MTSDEPCSKRLALSNDAHLGCSLDKPRFPKFQDREKFREHHSPLFLRTTSELTEAPPTSVQCAHWAMQRS